MGIPDRPTSLRSPWQNPYAEHLIGTLRQECLDHVLIFGERHLRRILALYFSYYNQTRTHLALGKIRCELTFRLGRTRPPHALSSGSETLSRIRFLAGSTIDTP
jgi:transposase InsO family protein